MSEPIIHTYRDAIERLTIWAGALASQSEQDLARAAVQTAYREIYQFKKWAYFARVRRIAVSAPYTTGTATFDLTGGSSERLVTLAGGTWPSWAAAGRIQFDGDSNVYRVASRLGDSTITLDSEFCPTADISTGVAYHLDRTVYNLPANCRSIERFHDESKTWQTSYVSPAEYLDLERNLDLSGKPWYWTIMGNPDEYGTMAVHLANRPASAETLDFLCYVAPRPLVFDGYGMYSSQGSHTLETAPAAGASATFAGVSLRADVVGAILRIAAPGATAPPGGIGTANQYQEQRAITARGSTTAVTVDTAWTLGKASDNAHFTIADPIDLPHFMLGAFEARCEAEMANLMHDDKKLAIALTRYDRALKEAMGRDDQYDRSDYDRWPTWESVFWDYHQH